jgi:hypothetical protein
MTKSAKRSPLVAFAGATAVWLVLCGVILMPLWPFVSPGRLQWILLVVLGPPFYAIGNYLGARVLGQRAGLSASGANPTVVRTLFAILVMLTLCAAAVVAARLCGLLT